MTFNESLILYLAAGFTLMAWIIYKSTSAKWMSVNCYDDDWNFTSVAMVSVASVSAVEIMSSPNGEVGVILHISNYSIRTRDASAELFAHIGISDGK